MKPIASGKYLTWLVALIVPVALALLAVRIVLNPWFLQFEYHTPNFPADPFGFTLEERLTYSRIALEYLVNDAGIEFVGDLRFPEGQQAPPTSCQPPEDCTRLFNERELKHFLDVKTTLQTVLAVLNISLLALILLGAWARYGRWGESYQKGLERGGILTVILIAVILFSFLFAFGVAFVVFHEIFFSAGTWSFPYSDTFIRLFPERFWRDTFLMVGSLAAGMGLLLRFVSRRLRKA